MEKSAIGGGHFERAYGLEGGGGISVVKEKGEKVRKVRPIERSQVDRLGKVQSSTQALNELVDADNRYCFSMGCGLFGLNVHRVGHKDEQLRRAQFEAAREPAQCFGLAKSFILGKVVNCRKLFCGMSNAVDSNVLRYLTGQIQRVEECRSMESLIGLEGGTARIYFGYLLHILVLPKPKEQGCLLGHKNRRPPQNLTNALLSYAYGILTKELMVTLISVGLDPYSGFYHQSGYGRPALALDLMEEFRPSIADSLVLSLIHSGIITDSDLSITGRAAAIGEEGRRKFLDQYERRMEQLVPHPVFDYKISCRQVLEVQARLLGCYLTGEIGTYPAFQER